MAAAAAAASGDMEDMMPPSKIRKLVKQVNPSASLELIVQLSVQSVRLDQPWRRAHNHPNYFRCTQMLVEIANDFVDAATKSAVEMSRHRCARRRLNLASACSN
jgi:hypothetical protein